MHYEKQVERLVRYMDKQSKPAGLHLLGAEFEHFVLNKHDLKAVSYYQQDGIEYILTCMLDAGWQGIYEDGYLIGLYKDGDMVTLEPGGQVEISIKPCKYISEIESRYFSFLNDIVPILDRHDKILIAVGYQPESRIKDIPWNPKKRYKYMSEYLKDKGCYAHNMMKGSAAIQVSIDYMNEQDYMKKFQTANKLSPVLSAVFDNSAFFEGKLFENKALRCMIWSSCDRDRCGIVPDTFADDFGFRKYAEYVLNNPPIFIYRKGKMEFTGNTLFKELFNPEEFTDQDIQHVLTMFFPDVRTKQYIEIRMADSIPYPLSFSYIALIKGLFYNAQSFKQLYEYMQEFDGQDVFDAKTDIIYKGIQADMGGVKIKDIMQHILNIAYSGLNLKEGKYLYPLIRLLDEDKTPADIIKGRLKYGKKQALKHCVINTMLKNKGVLTYGYNFN